MSSTGAHRGAPALPAYAAGSLGPWDAARSTYNWRANNTGVLRAGLNRAEAGTGLCNIGVNADSGATGFNDTTTIDANSWPRAMVSQLAAMLGTTVAGTGVVPSAADTSGRISDRWSISGGVGANGFPYFYGFGAGTATFVSQQTGTTACVFYLDVGSGNITWTVDGGATQTIVVGNTMTVKMATLTGLANTVHTVVMNLPATAAVTGCLLGGATTGITLHNLAFGGSIATADDVSHSWTDTSAYYSLQRERLAMLALAGVTLDCLFIELGVNDMVIGASPIAVMAAITSLRALFPAADCVLVHSYDVPGDTGNYAGLCTARYALADTLNVPLIDWNDRIGGQALAQARGQLGATNQHPTPATSIGFGKAIALAVAA